MFTSIEEWIRQVIDQLAVGQDVYLAPASYSSSKGNPLRKGIYF